MSKKLISLALMLMLLMTGVVYATPTPSPSNPDGMMDSQLVPKDGVTYDKDFQVGIEGDTDLSNEVFDGISEIESNGGSMADYFPKDVVREIDNILSGRVGNIGIEDLHVNEVMGFNVSSYKAKYQEVTINFSLLAEYTEGQTVVAMVGAENDGELTWFPILGEVQADGTVDITFPEDVMEALSGSDAVLAILSDAGN